MNWETIITMAGKLATETTSKYGPVAWDTMLWLTTIDNINTIVTAIVSLIILTSLSYGAYRLAAFLAKPSENCSYMFLIFLIIPWGLAANTYMKLFSIWVWVGVFKPELYLAKQLVDKVM